MNARTLNTLLAPLARRVRLMVSRAIISAVNDTSGSQLLTVTALEGEDRDQVRRLQGYGFTSVPLKGAECLVMSLNGNRDDLVAIQVEDTRYRLQGLESGAVALYTHDGTTVILQPGGRVEITAQTVTVSGDLEVEGSLVASGGISDSQGSLAALRTSYNSHVHVIPSGVSGGPQDPEV